MIRWEIDVGDATEGSGKSIMCMGSKKGREGDLDAERPALYGVVSVVVACEAVVYCLVCVPRCVAGARVWVELRCWSEVCGEISPDPSSEMAYDVSVVEDGVVSCLSVDVSVV